MSNRWGRPSRTAGTRVFVGYVARRIRRAARRRWSVFASSTARNFAPLMATAGKITIVQADEILPLGGIDPECVVTPGIFVHRVVEVREPLQESALVAEGVSYP